jgi:hypothetical protein
MATFEEEVVEVLKQSTELYDLFGTRIFTYGQLGRQGLTYTALKRLQGLEELNKTRIKPCILVRDRLGFASVAIKDEEAQYSSFFASLEIGLYQELNFDILEAGAQIVYELIQDKRIGGRRIIWEGFRNNRRAEDFLGVSEYVADFRSIGIRKPRNS